MVPENDSDRTLSGGNTNKRVTAHSQEEEKVNLSSLRDSQGTTTVNTVCESNGIVDGSCHVTILGPDCDLVKSQNPILRRKTDVANMVTVPKCHSSNWHQTISSMAP